MIGSDKICWWWLRPPGDGGNYVAYFIDSGYVGDDCDYVDDYGGVRPALWINLES